MAGKTISTSTNIGVYLTSPSSSSLTITNTGTITTGGNAVYAFPTFAATLVNNGLISTGGGAIYLGGGGSTVTNTGSIGSANGYGINLQRGGALTNAGRISANYNAVFGHYGSISITNTGVIIGGNDGAFMRVGGSVANGSATNSAASISGGAAGIRMGYLGTSSVTNFGTVSGTNASNSFGISCASLATIVNGSVTDTAATISGATGVFVWGAGASVSNFGIVTSTSGGRAIVFGGGGTVINGSASDRSALIEGSVYSAGPSNVVNFGTINGITTGSGTIDNEGNITAPHFAAIDIGSGAAVVLNGLGATISSPDTAIYAANVAIVTNLGTLSAGKGCVGLFDGSVTNGSSSDTTALISGRLGIGIWRPGTVTNYGTITGGTGGAVGASFVSNLGTAAMISAVASVAVHVTAPGSVQNQGSIAGATAVLFDAGGTLVNAGQITGTGGTAVSFASAPALLKMLPGASFSGLVSAAIGAGNVLELGASAVAGSIASLGGNFINFGTIALDAAAHWTNSGPNTLAAGSTIMLGSGGKLTESGTLAVAGALAVSGGGTLAVSATGKITIGAGPGVGGAITLASTAKGGTLIGSGTVTGPIFDSGLIESQGGTLSLGGAVQGAGTVAITPGSVLMANAAVKTAMTFLPGVGGTLAAVVPSAISGTIAGFAAGCSIDLIGKVATGESYDTAGYILTVSGTTGALASLHFAGSFTSASFAIKTDGHGGTLLTHT